MLDCAVVGASGYVGAEIVSLLAAHPEVNLVSLHADGSAGKRWEDLYPSRAHLFEGPLEAFEPRALAGLDVVFLAQPQGVAARAAAELRGRVGKIIDLSGDLRLPDARMYRHWYGFDHPAPELLGQAAYGLPELFGDSLRGADLIACAGCYATVAQLCAAPALGFGNEDKAARSARSAGADGADGGVGAVGAVAALTSEVVVSAMSGTTGAGRKADVELSFSEVTGNLRAYRVGRHQHAPEIAYGLGRLTGRAISVTFVPHLVPIGRGIFVTLVFRNEGGLLPSDLLAAYERAYSGCPFVRIVDPKERLPQVTDVAGTNFCDIAPVVDETAGTIVVLGVIDNLLKGAAGQAVQVMNIACGQPEETGLLPESKKEVRHA